MHVIGLIGGIASGKSAVAKELSALGASGAGCRCGGPSGHQSTGRPLGLGRPLGASILDAVGQVDRRAVAKRVFSADQGGQRAHLFWKGNYIL